MNNTSSFFKIDLCDIHVGISHHISNYKAIIKYCYENKLKLIKPIFTLTGHHNNGKEIISDLSMYYDLDNILVNDDKFTVYDELTVNIITRKYFYRRRREIRFCYLKRINRSYLYR